MKAIDLVHAYLNKHSLAGWRAEHTDSETIAGSCDYNNKRILLSENFCKYNKKGVVIDVILHEIAHALVGYEHKHNKVWKKKFIDIGGSGSERPRCQPFTSILYVCKPCGASYSYEVDKCSKCHNKKIVRVR